MRLNFLRLFYIAFFTLSISCTPQDSPDDSPIEDLSSQIPVTTPINEKLKNITPVGMHPGGIAGWTGDAYFSDFIKMDDRNWLIHGGSWDGILQELNPELINRDGYPIAMPTGHYLDKKGVSVKAPKDAYFFTNPGQGGDLAARKTYLGRYVLQWKGEADIRAGSGMEYLSGDPKTGTLLNGRRVYRTKKTDNPNGVRVEVRAIGATPITDIRLSMPDPKDPWNKSLEKGVFHPTFLERLADKNWAYIRIMNMISANGNPQQTWSDRRQPNHSFQEGIITTRTPAAKDFVIYDDKKGNVYRPTENRNTGMSYEYMVELANVSKKDLWLTTPHLLDDDALNKLAQLVAFGSDGVNPYDKPQENPKYLPLDSSLNVYLELSNELWQWPNDAFAQTIWAKVEADKTGGVVPEYNAQQFSRLWQIFETYLSPDRVHRVAAIWANSGEADSYTDKFINEFYNNKTLLKPEIISPATYFGNDIQQWVFDKKTKLPGNLDDPYWTSSQFKDDTNEMYDVWTQLMLSGKGYGGISQRDTVSQPGGFDEAIHDIAKKRGLALICYEGGPSIYTNTMNTAGGIEDDGITHFMNKSNRHPRIAELYKIHMHQSLERGVRSNSMFTMSGMWSKYGQWGHLEYLFQDPSTSPKYTFMKNWFDFASQINNVDTPVGSVPQFIQNSIPVMEVSKEVQIQIGTTGGEGQLDVEEIATLLPKGLKFDLATMTLSGKPVEQGKGFIYLMVKDADGDAAWKTFQIRVIKEGAYGPSVTLDFEGLAQGIIASGVYKAPSGYIVEDKGHQDSSDLDVLGIPNGFASTVVENHRWSRSLNLRNPGGFLNLTSFDYATNQWGGDMTVKVTAFFINGTRSTLTLSSNKKEMTTQVVNWKEVEKVEFKYAKANGAIDNLVLTH
jgi:hypothetical protein